MNKSQVRKQKLSVTVDEARAARKGQPIDKKQVTLHTKAADTADGTGTTSGVMVPNEEQLARINRFTRSPKTAAEVVVFNTLSANNLPDRDDDQFTDRTLRGFADLPDPYGSVGKSFMLSHNYSTLPVGRIFGAGTATVGGALYLTNEVYIPNTDQYKSLIENIDYGVNWAVSVGVMLEQVLCSVCESQMFSYWGMGVCENGHFKGSYYDPSSEETDQWGYPLEADPSAKNAIKALGLMDGAKDFYELSQVFLGAQFFAGLDSAKGASLKGVLKSAASVPVIGLSSKEAEDLPLQHIHPKVVHALAHYTVERGVDGEMKWADDDGLVWCYAPGSDVMCLGRKAAEDNSSSENNDSEADEEVESDAQGTGNEDVPGEADAELGGGDGDADGDEADGAEGVGDADAEGEREDGDLTSSDEDDTSSTAATADDQDEEEDVSKTAVLAAARRAKVPAVLLAAIAEGDGNGLEAVLRTASEQIDELTTQVSKLAPQARAGEQYLKDVRADAVDWYVKAHADGNSGVSTERFEKMLGLCGSDVELIKSLADEQRALAQAKFPQAVRRSSFPTDPHDRPYPAKAANEGSGSPHKTDAVVSRLH